MMWGGQTSLDKYLEIEEKENEEVENRGEGYGGEDVVEGEESEVKGEDNVGAFIRDPEHKSRCPYCDEWVGRLHGGALDLYVKDGGLKALADISHVYKDCRYGLTENIRFLYGLMVYLIGMGYRVFAVGKAYDDDLYAYIYGKREGYIEYKGLGVAVFEAPKRVEDFEK